MAEQPWNPGEMALAQRLGGCYAHAWQALEGRQGCSWLGKDRTGRSRSWRWPLGLIGVAALMMLPVPSSVLAPARVAPQNALVMAAPLDGVVETVLVKPHTPVEKGQALFQMEASLLQNRHKVAQLALRVSREKLALAQKGAFTDPERKARLPLLRAEIRQRQVEADHAKSLLKRASVHAPASGVAIFEHQNRWRGRPVKVGEKVMLIADPGKAELEIHLPAQSTLALQPGMAVRFFPDGDPLRPRNAVLMHGSYEAERMPDGLLAFRLTARFQDQEQPPPRIGLQGTAKLLSEEVPLFHYLFRRPMAALRQTIGF